MKTNHTLCISRTFKDSCVIKQKIKIKNIFENVVYSDLVVKKVLVEHKENCLILNGKQTVKLKSGSISFNNYFNYYLFLLKSMLILNVFQKELKVVIKIMAHTQKNISIIFPAVLLIKLCVFIRKQFLQSMIIFKNDKRAF